MVAGIHIVHMACTAYRAVARSLLLSLLAVGTLAAQYPPHSQRRAARHDAWREQLRLAEEAVRQERLDDAESAFRQVIDQAANAQNEGLAVARAVDGLADLCRDQGRLPEAAQLYERSASMWERLLGPLQPRLAVTYHNLGAVYLAMGEPRQAESRFLRALAIWEEAYGQDSAEAENSRRALRALASESSSSQESPLAD
jgi:tetratricopeptide (TPR) repeat protein